MKRLSGMDASFLYMETANMHMHVGGVFILDPKDVPGGYHFEKVRELLEARLHLLPPFRRRVVKIPFDLHHPLWVEDPEFDLDYHVRRVCLPKPGGRKELANFVAEVIGRPLDLNKPLWEMYVIEGLSDGMIALLPKTHHAAVDGVSGAELAAVLLDMTPEPRYVPPPEQPWKPERIPTDYELVSYAMISLALHPLSAYKAINRTIEMILNIRERNRMLEMLGIKPPPSLFSAPKTRINAAITPHRRFSFTEIDLEDFKFVKNNLGGTVNDTVLCVCASALRKYLTAHRPSIFKR
jgi:WS/DGAT/MGAT family acyltransferase